MWGKPSRIVVFGLWGLIPGGLWAQEPSPTNAWSEEASWDGDDWQRQEVGPGSWGQDPAHGDWKEDPWKDHDWDDDDWDDDRGNRWYEGRTSRVGPRDLDGRVRVRVGPVRASVEIGDRSLERAIRHCQRQTRRSHTWCRRRILDQRGPRSAWIRARWHQVYVHPPRNAYRRQRLSRRELSRTLEPWVLDGIRRHASRLGLHGNLRGTWEPAYRYGARIEVRMDGALVARIRDLDGDGWADDVLLRR